MRSMPGRRVHTPLAAPTSCCVLRSTLRTRALHRAAGYLAGHDSRSLARLFTASLAAPAQLLLLARFSYAWLTTSSMSTHLVYTSSPLRRAQAPLASPRSTHLPGFHSRSSSLFNAQRSIHLLHSPPVTDQSHHGHQWPLLIKIACRFPFPAVPPPLAHL
jgi:hypothetical protein